MSECNEDVELGDRSERDGDVLADTKRGRGRPKKYIDAPPPSGGQRSSKSVADLKKAGGKRVMLRVTPEANAALQQFMRAAGIGNETAAINAAILRSVTVTPEEIAIHAVAERKAKVGGALAM